MTDLRTAALRALERLIVHHRTWDARDDLNAITALRDALAQSEDKSQAAFEHWVETVEATQKPEQSIIKPEIKDDKLFGYFRAEPFGWTDCAPTDEGAIPLYTKVDSQGIAKQIPPEAQTEAEKIAYCAGWWAAMQRMREQAEPVAWRTFDGEGGYDYRTYDDNENYRDEWDMRNPNHKGWVEPLYTHQPRQWQGLTDDERDYFKACGFVGVKAVEEKLKELNT